MQNLATKVSLARTAIAAPPESGRVWQYCITCDSARVEGDSLQKVGSATVSMRGLLGRLITHA